MVALRRSHMWMVIAAIAVMSGIAGWGFAKLSETLLSDNASSDLQNDSGATRATSISQIRSNPHAFSGERVRLTGRLTECYNWECSLCPEDLTSGGADDSHCLPLSFRPLINGTGFGSSEQEEVFRFSSVVLTATFDPSCWEVICLDRQTVLMDAHVTSVTTRRAGARGLWLGDTTKLFEYEGNQADQMKAAAYQSGFPANPPIKAFSTGGAAPRFVVCWTSPVFEDRNPGKWPSNLESALYAQSTLDFFECNEVRRAEGQMVLQVRS